MKAIKSLFLILAALVAVPAVAHADAKRDAADAAVADATKFRADYPDMPTLETVNGYSSGAATGWVTAGETCLKAVAAASGSADEQALCQYEVDYGTSFNALIEVSLKAKYDAIAKKYIDLGVAGDRLALFVEYDDVYWYGKGCHLVDDINVVVKAKKLFQWLENSDGTHTIRTYTFKGNKYKIKEKTYATEAKAYKGCK